jgi:hypothetical protein
LFSILISDCSLAFDPRKKNICMDAISTDVYIGIKLKFHHEEEQLGSTKRATEESHENMHFLLP